MLRSLAFLGMLSTTVLVLHSPFTTAGSEPYADSTPVSVPTLADPELFENTVDPVFNMRLTRITDPHRAIPDLGSQWGGTARHHPSMDHQAWNADGSLLMLKQGTRGILIADGNTYKPLFIVIPPKFEVPGTNRKAAAQVRWHPVLADRLVYAGGNEIGYIEISRSQAAKLLNVDRGDLRKSLVATFPRFDKLRFSPKDKGNLSNDGRYIALAGETLSGSQVVFAVDLWNGTTDKEILATDVPGIIEYVSISPSGTYIHIVSQNASGFKNRFFYTRTGDLVARWRERNRFAPHDILLDENGDEAVVGMVRAGRHREALVKRRVADGAVTVLAQLRKFCRHTSARNIYRPGWVYVTCYGAGTKQFPPQPFYQEILAVSTDGSGEIEGLAHHRSSQNGGVFAAPSPDGTRLIFSSNWRNGLRDRKGLAAYVLELTEAAAIRADAERRRAQALEAVPAEVRTMFADETAPALKLILWPQARHWHFPDNLDDDEIEQLDSLPVDGMVVRVPSAWKLANTNFDPAARMPGSGPVASYEQILKEAKKMARLKRVTHNFFLLNLGQPPDFFDSDAAWDDYIATWKNFARVAKEMAWAGINFDTEPYIGVGWRDALRSEWQIHDYCTRYWTYEPGNPNRLRCRSVKFPTYSKIEYVEKARQRGRQLMNAVLEAYPETTIMFAHGPYLGLPWYSHLVTLRGHNLKEVLPYGKDWSHFMGLFTGMLEAAEGTSAKLVDGGELYDLRQNWQFEWAYQFRKHEIVDAAVVDNPYISIDSIRESWPNRVSIAFGLWNGNSDPSTMRTALTQALVHADEYAWFYTDFGYSGENFDWHYPPGRSGVCRQSDNGCYRAWIDAIADARAAAKQERAAAASSRPGS